jgi:hypothetical protein
MSVSVAPHKTDPPLIVDAYAVLARSIALQLMKPIARRHSQIRQALGSVKHQKFSPCRLSNIREPANTLIVEQLLRVPAIKGPYHIQSI